MGDDVGAAVGRRVGGVVGGGVGASVVGGGVGELVWAVAGASTVHITARSASAAVASLDALPSARRRKAAPPAPPRPARERLIGIPVIVPSLSGVEKKKKKKKKTRHAVHDGGAEFFASMCRGRQQARPPGCCVRSNSKIKIQKIQFVIWGGVLHQRKRERKEPARTRVPPGSF